MKRLRVGKFGAWVWNKQRITQLPKKHPWLKKNTIRRVFQKASLHPTQLPREGKQPRKPDTLVIQNIQSDLVGMVKMVKWPLQGVKWSPTWKGHGLNHLDHGENPRSSKVLCKILLQEEVINLKVGRFHPSRVLEPSEILLTCGVSTPTMVGETPTNPWVFPIKNDDEIGGYHHFRKHPYEFSHK